MTFAPLFQSITFAAVNGTFQCGDNYYGLRVVNFSGPNNARLSAYCCNMNIDADGEPQAYAAFESTTLRPRDGLGDAGWKSAADNNALKAEWQAALNNLSNLEAQKVGLLAKKVGASELTDIDDKITKQKEALKNKYYWDELPANRPKNYGKLFWHWYGVKSLTPAAAKSQSTVERIPGVITYRRHPVLNTRDIYEDVYGTFPVVQSVFEPGPGYFVSQLPHAHNPDFAFWDQRYFLPPAQLTQGAYGALSTGLAAGGGLALGDTVLATRLDRGQSLAFPFRDSGYGMKVGECSMEAFASLGGALAQFVNKSNNNFLLLYLAFPKGQSPADALANFAMAANADELPMYLSFIVEATMSAQGRSKTVSADPVANFERWRKTRNSQPAIFPTVEAALTAAGFNPWVQRMARQHAKAVGGPGPFLTR